MTISLGELQKLPSELLMMIAQYAENHCSLRQVNQRFRKIVDACLIQNNKVIIEQFPHFRQLPSTPLENFKSIINQFKLEEEFYQAGINKPKKKNLNLTTFELRKRLIRLAERQRALENRDFRTLVARVNAIIEPNSFWGLDNPSKCRVNRKWKRLHQNEAFQKITQLLLTPLWSDQTYFFFPPQIYSMESLTKLELYKTNIRLIPTGVVNLTALQDLQLNDNPFLQPLPYSELTSLTKLSLCRNNAEVLENSMTQLTRLITLIMRNINLRSLPPYIGELTSLRVIDLSNNNLTDLPESVSKLKGLEEFELLENELLEIPPVIFTLRQLKLLNLSYNRISTLSKEMNISFPQLQFLALGGNCIAYIPPDLIERSRREAFELEYKSQVITLTQRVSCRLM